MKEMAKKYQTQFKHERKWIGILDDDFKPSYSEEIAKKIRDNIRKRYDAYIKTRIIKSTSRKFDPRNA